MSEERFSDIQEVLNFLVKMRSNTIDLQCWICKQYGKTLIPLVISSVEVHICLRCLSELVQFIELLGKKFEN